MKAFLFYNLDMIIHMSWPMITFLSYLIIAVGLSDVYAPSCKRFNCCSCGVTETTQLQLLIVTYYTVKMFMRSPSGNPVMSLKNSSWPPGREYFWNHRFSGINGLGEPSC
jgi:hypothetical protein